MYESGLDNSNWSIRKFENRTISFSCRYLLRGHQFRNFDTRPRAPAGFAGKGELIRGAVDHPQPFADVGESDTAGHRLLEPFEQKSHPVVLNFDHQAGVV